MEKTMYILLAVTALVHGERKHPSDGPIPVTESEGKRLIDFGTAKDVTQETLAEIAAAEEAAAAAAQAEADAAAEAEAQAAAEAEAEAEAEAAAAAQAQADAAAAAAADPPTTTGKAKTAKAAETKE